MLRYLQLLLLRVQIPDRADVLALMRRHPCWPVPGSPVAEAAEQDGHSDSDGAAGLSDDAQDDMQLAPAARLPRGAKPRSYNAQERAVMREFKLSHLANVTCRTLTAGAVRWDVKLNAEGLGRRSRTLHGES